MVARRIGVNAMRLTEMITTDEKGEPNRNITPYYLAKFIEADIMSVEEILENKKLADIIRLRMSFFRTNDPFKKNN